MIKTFLIIVAVLMIPIYGNAKDSQLYIDGVLVTIGMEKSQVENAFAKTHTLIKTPPPSGIDECFVVIRNSRNGGNNGILRFKKDKLSSAGVEWGSHNGSNEFELGKNIYGAFSSVIASGNNIRNVKVMQKALAGVTNYFIIFEFENRDIEIILTDSNIAGKVVSVQEDLNY
jgi:hypothetical protein